jgi:4-aminobutyrate aminotransferase-like enzyme
LRERDPTANALLTTDRPEKKQPTLQRRRLEAVGISETRWGIDVGVAVQRGDLIGQVAEKGDALLRELEQKGATARGRGLMLGLVEKDAAAALGLSRRLLAKGYIVLTGGAAGNVLTLSPPLTIAPTLLSAFASALVD